MATGKASMFRRVARAGTGLLAGAACVVGLSSAVAAVSGSTIHDLSLAAADGLGAFTPASVDPKLVDTLRRARGTGGDAGSLFRFTPAGTKTGPRSITVAVRVDAETAQAISVRKAADKAGRGVAGVAPVAFNLGVSRGYQSFVQSDDVLQTGKRSLTIGSPIGEISAPDLRTFTPAKSPSDKSRFSTVVELDEKQNLPGASPRTFAGSNDMSVDVGGAYRVAGNLKVTAGIRYQSERDRLTPLTDGQQDSQSVYVGTRFRF